MTVQPTTPRVGAPLRGKLQETVDSALSDSVRWFNSASFGTCFGYSSWDGWNACQCALVKLIRQTSGTMMISMRRDGQVDYDFILSDRDGQVWVWHTSY